MSIRGNVEGRIALRNKKPISTLKVPGGFFFCGGKRGQENFDAIMERARLIHFLCV